MLRNVWLVCEAAASPTAMPAWQAESADLGAGHVLGLDVFHCRVLSSGLLLATQVQIMHDLALHWTHGAWQTPQCGLLCS